MRSSLKKSLKYAFLKSVPIIFGFIFLGMAFGILLAQEGFGFIWAFAISFFIYAGSLQFVLVPLLASGAGLLTVATTTLFVNSRHIFYGLSFLEEFKSMGKKLPYMIFALTDETYSVLCSCRNEETPSGTKLEWFFISLLNQSYWVLGSLLGSLVGGLIPFDFTGIDFSMTALFVVILIDLVRNGRTAETPTSGIFPAVAGGAAGIACLLIFGANSFLLPSLIITVAVLFAKDKLQVSEKRHVS